MSKTEAELFIFCFQSNYRLAIRTEGMIPDLVKNLKTDNAELQMHCASAIFKVCIVQIKYDTINIIIKNKQDQFEISIQNG